MVYKLYLKTFLSSSSTQQRHSKNGNTNSLCLPRQYKDVHANPDSDCYLLRVFTLNFIFTPVVMGMTLTTVSTTYSSLYFLVLASKEDYPPSLS